MTTLALLIAGWFICYCALAAVRFIESYQSSGELKHRHEWRVFGEEL